MRRLFTALPFALLPYLVTPAHAEAPQHGSLGTHEHGVAQLNAVLEGAVLELELRSPAMNLVGFEHLAGSAADQAKVANVRTLLEQPLALFELDATAGCHVTEQTLQSPLFGDKMAAEPEDDDDDQDHDATAGEAHHHEHSEIHAHYQLACTTPGALKQIGLAPLFRTFPATRLVQVQLITPNGQRGLDASTDNALLKF